MEDQSQGLPSHLPPLNPVSSQMPPDSLKQVSRSPQGEDGPVGAQYNFHGAEGERPLRVKYYGPGGAGAGRHM